MSTKTKKAATVAPTKKMGKLLTAAKNALGGVIDVPASMVVATKPARAAKAPETRAAKWQVPEVESDKADAVFALERIADALEGIEEAFCEAISREETEENDNDE